jgi:hypothetical protein
MSRKRDPQFDALNAVIAWRGLEQRAKNGKTFGERARARMQVPVAKRKLRRAADQLLAAGW